MRRQALSYFLLCLDVRGSLIRFVFLTSLALAPFFGQEPIPNKPVPLQPHSQYFSGFVAEMTDNAIVVTRKSPADRKTFLMDHQTKVDGKLHANVRVTVRFESTPLGDRAIRIIVRG